MKRKATDWEKLFANHIFNKELVLWIYKDQNSTVKNQTIQLENKYKTKDSSPKRVYSWQTNMWKDV